jgi:uncharacterized damage-inducible protein DinB
MKKILVTYASYNLWANKLYVDCINNLEDEQIHQVINSSFFSVYKTLLHLWDVETIWWQRLKLVENAEWPGAKFKGSVMELGNNLLLQSKQWKEWVDLATEAALDHEFIYKNSKKDQFKQPVYEALHHLFNHQTHHRGQLSTMLRQVGVDKIPNTDLIAFSRKK